MAACIRRERTVQSCDSSIIKIDHLQRLTEQNQPTNNVGYVKRFEVYLPQVSRTPSNGCIRKQSSHHSKNNQSKMCSRFSTHGRRYYQIVTLPPPLHTQRKTTLQLRDLWKIMMRIFVHSSTSPTLFRTLRTHIAPPPIYIHIYIYRKKHTFRISISRGIYSRCLPAIPEM